MQFATDGIYVLSLVLVSQRVLYPWGGSRAAQAEQLHVGAGMCVVH